MTLAQLINVLYSVVDRVYIGHLQGVSANALTGIGLALPIITIITAFANLFGMGGAPLCSIARGSHEEEKAEKVMGNSCSMLLFTHPAEIRINPSLEPNFSLFISLILSHLFNVYLT